MKSSADELLEIILEYDRLIRKGNALIAEYYDIECNPLLAYRRGRIPREGEIIGKSFRFNFHGMGCFFVIESMYLDFVYAYGSYQYEGFKRNKLIEFIADERNGYDASIVNDIDNSLQEQMQRKAIKLRPTDRNVNYNFSVV